MAVRISIIWKKPSVSGIIMLTNAGTLSIPGSVTGGDAVGHSSFSLDGGDCCRLEAEVADARMETGSFATVVNVQTLTQPFSFFLRDVNSARPIFIPQYKVIVTESSDTRSYDRIAESIRAGGRQNRLEAIGCQPEESFERAARRTRDLKCVTWLGLSRDIRNFEVSFHGMKGGLHDIWDSIRPRYHGMDVKLPELEGRPVEYDYFCGRGFSCILERKRWLGKGILPILNASLEDEEVAYGYVIFATTEKSALTMENVKGTNYLVADKYSHGSMFTESQANLCAGLHDTEMEKDEETVCYVRIMAVNRGTAPKYAFMRLPQPNVHSMPDWDKVSVQYDAKTGFGCFSEDRVFLVATLNGRPAPGIEMAVLLAPGEKAEYVFKIPHRPVSAARAEQLANLTFMQKLQECTSFWEKKIGEAAVLRLPEKRIDEMMRAGLLHCDLVAYGNEPDGAVAPTIGVYSAIGSESAPIIQYFDSMGLHSLARRAIMYFIGKQHDDGFMQNFGGYMLETGCVLWTIGEHWRYTRDSDWIRSIRGNIVRAVEYIIAWRNRNKREELRGCGYGMLDGKVADPEDNYHIFMLNSTAYIGLKRAAEVLSSIGDSAADDVGTEAEAFLKDILASADAGFAKAPAVPLGSGEWCPSLPVWAERPGPLCLQTSGGTWFTHGSMVVRDTLLSAQYMILDEVIEPDSVEAGFILNCLADVFMRGNTAFSQPYYSPHPYANLRRGEVKAFLKEFYTNMSSLADRETYTFWEVYYQIGPHKTHEEGWFLMRCRWLLYLETGSTLNILPGVPRAWLEDGKKISVEGVASYFGPLSFTIDSNVSRGKVSVNVKVDGQADRLPERLVARIPHPDGLKAVSSSAGSYDPETETVVFERFSGEVGFELNFY